ncbi:MAG: BatD family protein [Phycisphaeraceae bacterium]|nr:MAG: BatD family protein [Phycisphaeraceae bacterium]
MQRYIQSNPLAVFLAFAAALLTGSARAQSGGSGGKAEATFSQQVCYLGDQITYQISIDDAGQATPPDLSNIPGASFDYMGATTSSSSFISIFNGQPNQEVTNKYIMQWQVTPDASGTLVVPPQKVDLGGGKVVETAAASIRVLEPEQAGEQVITATLDDDALYVGQTTRLHVTWVLLGRTEGFSFRGTAKTDDFTFRPFGQAGRSQDDAYRIDIFGASTPGRLGWAMFDGTRTRTLEFDLLVTPRNAGEFTLGPIKVTYDERVDIRSNRHLMASTDPIKIKVLDLPSEGRPDGFTGLLGTHAIDVTATPTDVNVGDPIELTVTISGPEPMDNVTDGPDLALIPGFAGDFRTASEGWTYKPGRIGERTFTTTIRAAHEGVAEIPRIPLAFFDPGEGEYRVARSKPIPIRVRAVHQVTAADAVVSTGPATVSREALTASDPGVWAITRGPVVLADTRGLSGDALRNPIVVAALAAPPGFFALAAVGAYRRRHRQDEAARRRRGALASARRALHRCGPADAVRVYLAEAFGATPAAITGADGRRLLAEAGVSDADAVSELIAVHEAEHYAAGRYRPDAAADPARVLDLLRRVDRSIRRGA